MWQTIEHRRWYVLPSALSASIPCLLSARTIANVIFIGLSVHMNQVHKENLTSVENALANRQGLDIEIFGMEGVPEDIIQQHNQRIIQNFYTAQAERQAATGNPPRGLSGGQGPTKKIKIETPEEIKKRLAEHRAKVAAQKEAIANGTPLPVVAPANGPSPSQVVRAIPIHSVHRAVLTYHSLNRLLLSLHRSQVSHILQEPQHTLLLLTPPGQPLALLAASRRDLQVVARSLRHSRRDLLTRTPVVWPLLASQVLHQSTNLRPMPVEHPVAMISIS